MQEPLPPLIEAASAYLRQERFSASVLAVVAHRVADGEALGEAGALWATVEVGGEVVGAAMQTPPWNLFVARLAPAAVMALADAVADAGVALPGDTRWALPGETRLLEPSARGYGLVARNHREDPRDLALRRSGNLRLAQGANARIDEE